MSDKNRRLTAQDFVNDGSYVFGEATTFERAYLTIDTIRIEYTISFVGGFPRDDEQCGSFVITDKKYIGEFIGCRNSKCYGGGFQIGWILHDMVNTNTCEKSGSINCCGHEGTPKGKKIYRKCMNKCDYKIVLTFKQTLSQPTTGRAQDAT